MSELVVSSSESKLVDIPVSLGAAVTSGVGVLEVGPVSSEESCDEL